MLLGNWQLQQRQQQSLSTFPLQKQQFAALLIALILLQHVDLHMCRRIGGDTGASATGATSKRMPHFGAAAAAPDKRTLIAGGGSSGAAGQPEEIFSIGDQMEANYDEYPMVVPKRAALLLDRLMVALHHALEKERGGPRRISEFYANRNAGGGFKDQMNSNKEPIDAAEKPTDDAFEQGSSSSSSSPHYNMYSDDDPTVIMDYDFKDLNSINRATGETLMAKSFQRRANMGLVDMLGGDMGAEGVAMLAAAAAAGDDVGISGGGGSGGGGRNNAGTGGRTYWRCYFNAVSCF